MLQIEAHRSTIVFANNRRVVERVTAHLNERAAPDDDETFARAHHGSLNLDERCATEAMLKEGKLRAVVSTASLELGIDMGAVDLVCQVESPGSVCAGLQRVGRAGHVVGRVSKGRLIAKTRGDLLEAAALARAMIDGEVEPLRVPRAVSTSWRNRSWRASRLSRGTCRRCSTGSAARTRIATSRRRRSRAY